jgi:formamidopyrimidine-DNA glycosylase
VPELPDITIYIEALQSRIAGERLDGIRLRSPFLLRSVAPPLDEARGKRVVDLRRLGKRIVVSLEADLHLVIHLMIAGRFRWQTRAAKIPGKLGLAAFDFTSGTLLLTEAAKQKRASLHLVAGAAGLADFDRGGVEVFDADAAAFRATLVSENHTVKRALTDPRLFSGIGNAYSDEILHRAGLSPVKWTSRLTDGEVDRLYIATREVLREWVGRLRAETGGRFPAKVTAFRPEMAVHGKYREPCPVCATPVQRIRYAANETNYCPTCQTGGKLLADRALSRLLKGDWPKTLEELEDLKRARRDPQG